MGHRFALVGFLALVASGCAAIAGVDQFSEGPCAGGECDGSAADGFVIDGAPRADAGDATTSGDAGAGDATTSGDAGAGDATTSGDAGAGDAASDAAKDASPPQDGGGSDCGALDTPLNCTACGDSCDVLHSNSATCNGATCVYASCHAGWSDCNTTAPNLDGCECNTPACCGSSCQTTHSNGIGESFYDCVAQGTYDSTQGTEACGAYTGNQAQCSSSGCTGPGSNQVVCGTSGGICVCWDYSGSNAGHVYSSGTAGCYCPGSTDPSWN